MATARCELPAYRLNRLSLAGVGLLRDYHDRHRQGLLAEDGHHELGLADYRDLVWADGFVGLLSLTGRVKTSPLGDGFQRVRPG